jgi:hypothetical protein
MPGLGRALVGRSRAARWVTCISARHPRAAHLIGDYQRAMVGRKPMRRRRSDRQPPPQSFGATARPSSPRSFDSTTAAAAAVATDLDELLLTAPPPSASEPRSFSYAVKQQCWEKAERVPGRDPERWRRDALGNIVFRKLVGCPGCLCHDYDHIVPYSKVPDSNDNPKSLVPSSDASPCY